jgi:hypothetical protein
VQIQSSSLRLSLIAGLVSTLTFASDIAAQQRAVEQTIANTNSCQNLGDFYWEIGDGSGPQGSGQVGQSITANGVIKLASASKWVFGAYVAQKTGGQPTQQQIDALEMRSGYDQLNDMLCGAASTIDGCLSLGNNGQIDAAHFGYFSYDGGHDEMLAHTMGLGKFTVPQLTQELQQTLGPGVDIAFNGPLMAGGMESSPSAYGGFLRKIINGQLEMSGLLGSHAVCTQPATCAQAVNSPSPYPWHYSLNHWIEDAPGQDGAFSSPGKFGFYPWITADRQGYGIVARVSTTLGAFLPSAQCGAAMRAAWANAGSYAASVSASGPLIARTLDASLTPERSDLGQTGSVFILAELNGRQFALNSQGNWQVFDPANPVAYSSGKLQAVNTRLTNAADLRPLVGTTVYLGYGLGSTAAASAADMGNRALLVAAYTIGQ